jgi:hypothetical protein
LQQIKEAAAAEQFDFLNTASCSNSSHK